jgi:hypothetical protein
MLSYQHSYHAGNLADIHKHAALAWVLSYLLKKPKPLTYLESHAGRGLYDLTSRESAKTGEAEAGITLALKTGWFDPAHPYLRALQDCRALVLETNHDEELLRDGPYPWKLKQRVRSNHGHLSNNAAGNLLQNLLWNGLETVFLGHLSETNNRPDLAVEVVREVLEKQNICEPQVLLGKQHLPVLWAA